MVATPPASVGLVAPLNEPPWVLDHATLRPAALTGLLFGSTSCAVTITAAPAAAVYELELTRYLTAGPATNDTVAFPVVIADPLTVAPIVALPTAVGDANVAV